MRIAVYHNLPSGGAKRALFEIVKRLCHAHQFDVYTLSSANHEFGDLKTYAHRHQIYEFSDGNLLQSPFGRLNMLIRKADLNRVQSISKIISNDIEREGYDILFANPCRVETSPSILREVRSLPKVYYCQEPPRVVYESYPARPYTTKSVRRKRLDMIDPLPGVYFHTLRENDRKNFFAADLVLVNSRFMQQNIQHVYGQHAEICYLGTDIEEFLPLNLEKGQFVLSVGSLTPLKNFDFLIEAIACIPETLRPEFWIAFNFQNPPEREYLETLAADKGVRLRLLGNVSDAELVEFYNQAAVTVYSPIREPFGLVPLESMACATPVVAVKEGGMAETIVHGETGFLVNRDPQEFAQALVELLSNPDKAYKFGQAGREHVVHNWTWQMAARRFETYLYQVTKLN